MRPEVAQEVKEWLERAAEDWREAEHDLAAAPPFLRGALFHCQQAAEKAIKAFYLVLQRDFRYTHDLGTLLKGSEEKRLVDAVLLALPR